MKIKYVSNILILIYFLLFKIILNDFNSEDNENNLNKLKENRKSKKNHIRKEVKNDYNFTSSIDEIKFYLSHNYTCTVLYGNLTMIINNKDKKSKQLNFIEIQYPSGKYKYYVYELYENYTQFCKRIEVKFNKSFNLVEYYKDFDELGNYLRFFNASKLIENAYSKVNVEPCFQVSNLDEYEKSLYDHLEELNENYWNLCDENCNFEGSDISKLEIKCYCPKLVNMEEETFWEQIKNYIKNFGNFQVLKCSKLLFSKSGLKYNYGSEMILFMALINFICVIYSLIYIYRENYFILIKDCKNYIGTQTYDFKKIYKLKSSSLDKNKLTNEQIEIIEDLCNYKINNKKHETNKYKDNSDNIINNNNSEIREIHRNNDYIKGEIIKKLNEGELYSYYDCIIYFYPKEKYFKYLIEDEINNLNNKKYNIIENRDFSGIFWSTFSLNYDFLNTFFITFNKDYKFYQIKIMNYINIIILSLSVNIFFYSDNTMHKIYIDSGEKSALNRLPIIILTNVSQTILSMLFEFLFLCQDQLIGLKISMENENDKVNRAINIYKILKIKLIICIIITIFLDISGWYYISCFFAVYLKTQQYLFIDFLSEFLFNIISTLIMSLIYSWIKIIIIEKKVEKILYIKILNNSIVINVILILLQIIISFIINKFVNL